jgi:serine protease Do
MRAPLKAARSLVAGLAFTMVAAPIMAQTVPTIDIRRPDQAEPYSPLRNGAVESETQNPAVPASQTQRTQPQQNMMMTPISALPSIADLVARVSQSTVNIIVTTSNGEMLSEGQGSGFVISPQREVVTNYHVIEGGETIEIEFNDGRRYPARTLGTDEETDLALLTFDANETIPYVKFHQGQKSRIGDWVVAIGNPFGIGQSTSLGVISAIGRKRVDSGSYVDYIQTDATINRGNSGGPLFNLNGDVVGVNSAIYSPTGASVGIAFVIPHETAASVVSALRSEGRVRRGYLGAGLRDAVFEMEGNPEIFKSGALVNNLVPGSPAEVYGLQIDDIILKINRYPVRNSVEATRAIGLLAPGDVANIIFERLEKTYEIPVSIGERPEKADVERDAALSRGLPPPAPKSEPHARININTGVHVLDISAEFRTAIGMRSDQVGVYVESVDPGSEAEMAGFEIGQVLLEADGTPIAEVDKWRSMVLNAKLDKKTSMKIKLRPKNGGIKTLDLPT